MSEQVNKALSDCIDQANQFNSNDVLVHCDNDVALAFDFNFLNKEIPLSNQYLKIIQKAKAIFRETGIDPLCMAMGSLHWDLNGRTIYTPILLRICKCKMHKVKQTIVFSTKDEVSFVNPFLRQRLYKEFGVVLPESLLENPILEDLIQFLYDQGFKEVFSQETFLGNFHHHRYEILKELDELSHLPFSDAILELFGEKGNHITEKLVLDPQYLFDSDTDQLNVFEVLENQNVVLQGPPGTGKSQVICNLLAKSFGAGNNVLVVSEKRVALEVIQKKLKAYGLDRLCFIADSQTDSKSLFKDLLKSWQFLEQHFGDEPKLNLRLSEQVEHHLQSILDVAHLEDAVGGISLSQFFQISKNLSFEKTVYQSNLIDLKNWLRFEKDIELLFNEKLNSLVSRINIGVFKEKALYKLDLSIKEIEQLAHNLGASFAIGTIEELRKAMKLALWSQHYSNEWYSKHSKILNPNSKEQKRFLKLFTALKKHKLKAQKYSLLHVNWKIAPSIYETEDLLQRLEDQNLFSKFSFRKRWKKYTTIAETKAGEILTNWLAYLKCSNDISQILIEINDIFGISDEVELESIYQTIQNQVSKEWDLISKLSEEQRKLFASENSNLHKLYTLLTVHFHFSDSDHYQSYLTEIQNNLADLISYQSFIQTWPDSMLRSMGQFQCFEDFKKAVLFSNWSQFLAHFPRFKDFEPTKLLDLARQITTLRKEESKYFSKQIEWQQIQKFKYYHQLIQNTSKRLNEAEKELKKRLKTGKAILVKEFAKSRSHPTLREIFETDALLWIKLLKPFWLSSPSQVAQSFPLQQDLFSLLIFDEASQIPLQNALGSMQRAQRILVAGDSQQMGPRNYFKSGSEEQISVLHQASYYWKNVNLKHHYRSENPVLIAFSNQYFYDNTLKAFPSFDQIGKPIVRHFVKDGVFVERINEAEAKQVSDLLEKILTEQQSIGIVAFSERQVHAIYELLSPKSKMLLDQRIEDGSLFLKSLENVQGEECDHLVISMAYAKDEKGAFHMRFGPLNAKNGSKRLNVLFTRAKSRIDIFTSVESKDFKLSSNESVNLLRLYLMALENETWNQNNQIFPIAVQPTIKGQHVLFENSYLQFKSAKELVTIVQTLGRRKWKIEFVD